MHIGTGKFEGKEIKDGTDGLPLSTRVLTMKESIFEIIGVRIHEASVLDINDKNGMYGIDAISKGAAVVQFLNLHDDESSLVKENLKVVGLDPGEYVIEQSPEEFLTQDSDVHYDVIFFRAIDGHCLKMLEKVLDYQNENGITVIQHPDNADCKFDKIPKGYQVVDERSIETDKCLVMLKKQ